MSDDEDEEFARRNELEYVSGKKEDFISMLNASYESNNWVRKYRDYECYLKMLPNGKLHDAVAKTKGGEYAGSCICLEFDDMAFVAIYYVCPKFRKKGVGRTLFDKVVNSEVRKKNVGLHAVQEMSPIYNQVLGFNKLADWLVDITKISIDDPAKINAPEELFKIRDAKEVGLEKLLEYDKKIYKSTRESFVRCWAVERNDSTCKVIFNASDEIVGYGCARLMSVASNPAVAPIYCDSDDAFLVLFKTLISCYPEEVSEKKLVDIRSPSVKTPRIKEILSHASKVEVKTQCVPQFTKFVPDHDISRVYGITEMMMFL